MVYHSHGGFVIGSEMSGGARNIFVEDCSFMGSDNGLRFKTARGRGGVVENIFVRNIAMKDIVHDAILFDMYYFTKPPAKLADGQPAAPEPIPAVTEATPQFRNFTISHIVCDGAERGVFMRGIPEMNVRQIKLDDLVLRTNKGVELIEAQDIQLTNLQLQTLSDAPVVSVENSHGLRFDGLTVAAPTGQPLFSVSGPRSSDINVAKAETGPGRPPAEFKAGANSKVLKIKK